MREIGAVYQAYFQDVYHYALKLTGERQLALDLTSDTFMKAIDALDNFRGQSQLRVWLCQITRNLYLSYLRKERRLVPLDGMPEPEAHDAFSDFLDREEAGNLSAISAQIREPYCQVFRLRVWGELPFGEIGGLFGRNANWACVVYHRARKMIREQYEEET